MIIFRSLVFNLAFYVNLIVQMIVWTPYYFLSPFRRAARTRDPAAHLAALDMPAVTQIFVFAVSGEAVTDETHAAVLCSSASTSAFDAIAASIF